MQPIKEHTGWAIVSKHGNICLDGIGESGSIAWIKFSNSSDRRKFSLRSLGYRCIQVRITPIQEEKKL